MDDIITQSEFSLLGLLLEADPIVKAVLVILVIASIWSWAVVIDKSTAIGAARKKTSRFEDDFWSGRGDFDFRPGQVPDNAGARLFGAILREWRESKTASLSEQPQIIARAERALRVTVDREVSKLGKGIGALATIGSASPFIGLFGTVWGIMNAFLNISAKQDTSLITVAGPIAEALFATGLGLVAAIPAVIFYNKFTGDLNHYADSLDGFSQDLLVRLSRRSTGPS